MSAYSGGVESASMSAKLGNPIFPRSSAEIGLILYQSNCHLFMRKEKHEPRGRENQEFVMVGRFNRTTDFGNSRGFIFTV